MGSVQQIKFPFKCSFWSDFNRLTIQSHQHGHNVRADKSVLSILKPVQTYRRAFHPSEPVTPRHRARWPQSLHIYSLYIHPAASVHAGHSRVDKITGTMIILNPAWPSWRVVMFILQVKCFRRFSFYFSSTCIFTVIFPVIFNLKNHKLNYFFKVRQGSRSYTRF